MEAPARDVRLLLRRVAEDLARGKRSFFVGDPDGRARRADELCRQADDALIDLVQARGGRELATELQQRRGALRLAPRGLVEPRILDGNCSVARQHLEEANVVLVELVEAELRD